MIKASDAGSVKQEEKKKPVMWRTREKSAKLRGVRYGDTFIPFADLTMEQRKECMSTGFATINGESCKGVFDVRVRITPLHPACYAHCLKFVDRSWNGYRGIMSDEMCETPFTKRFY